MNLEKEVFDLSLADILPNRFQPREKFDDNELNELSMSIKEHGVIQPIVVRKIGDKYEIVAGERRFRASQLAGLTTIPAIIRNIDDKESAKVALLENLQRKNLTSIEEARTYQTILKLDNLTQEELATTLGKSQSAIANKLRLLNLIPEVQDALLHEKISERHARSLLNVSNPTKQKELLDKIIMQRMTVKQLDDEIAMLNGTVNTNVYPEEEMEKEPVKPVIEEQPVVVEPKIETVEEQVVEPKPVNKHIFDDLRKDEPINNTNEVVSNELELPKDPFADILENTYVPSSKEVVNAPKEDNGNIPAYSGPKYDFASYNVPETSYTAYNKIESMLGNNNQNTENNQNTLNIEQPQIVNQEISETPLNNDIYDMRFAINNFRQAIQNTEKFGFKIETEEFDFDNVYQIVIKIDKNKKNIDNK